MEKHICIHQIIHYTTPIPFLYLMASAVALLIFPLSINLMTLFSNSKAIGCRISEYFEKDFYIPNEALPEYQVLRDAYIELEKRVNKLIEGGKISKATAEAIKYRNGIIVSFSDFL